MIYNDEPNPLIYCVLLIPSFILQLPYILNIIILYWIFFGILVIAMIPILYVPVINNKLKCNFNYYKKTDTGPINPCVQDFISE